MKFEDIFKTEEIVLEETRIYEQKTASEFDKETKHTRRIIYQPEAFKTAFKDIIEDDKKYPTRDDKIKAIQAKSPFWAKHLSKILKEKP